MSKGTEAPGQGPEQGAPGGGSSSPQQSSLQSSDDRVTEANCPFNKTQVPFLKQLEVPWPPWSSRLESSKGLIENMMKLSSFNWIYSTLQYVAGHQINLNIILLFMDECQNKDYTHLPHYNILNSSGWWFSQLEHLPVAHKVAGSISVRAFMGGN